MRVLTGRVMYSETEGESGRWHTKGQQGAQPLQVWPSCSDPTEHKHLHTFFLHPCFHPPK